MILVIPSIELTNGTSPRKIIGEKGTEAYYKSLAEDPLALCRLWRKENSKSLQIVDNDSFYSDNNHLNANAILYISDSIDIPLQLYSNFQTCEECSMFLDNGVYRVTLTDLALRDPEGVKCLLRNYTPSRVAFSIRIANGRVHLGQSGVSLTAVEYAGYIKNLGAQRAVYGDISYLNTGTVVNFDTLKSFATETKLRLTLNQGIYTPEHLWQLSECSGAGIDSVILGKALYENNFPCQKIWREMEASLEANLY